MKRRLLISGIFWMGLFALALKTGASEVRVDSTGGLDMVISDETADINPYTLGNPAGLALLPTQSQFEVNAPWYSTTNASGDIKLTNFGISPGYFTGLYNLANFTAPLVSTAGYQYQGFLDVPGDGWAFQATGGVDKFLQQETFGSAFDNYQNQNTQGLARLAYNFGPLTLGTEVQLFNATDYIDLNVLSKPVTGTQTVCVLNTGLLANFPLGRNDQSSQLRLGGSFSMNVLPWKWGDLTEDPGIKALQPSFEPSLFLILPNSFQGGILLDLNYLNNKTGDVGFNGTVLYKWKMILEDSGDHHPVSFNHGILFEWINGQDFNAGTWGTPLQIYDGSGFLFQIGMGLEMEKDFTFGLQADGISFAQGTQTTSGIIFQNYNYTYSRIILGGEMWVSSDWALRMGLTYLDDQETGASSLAYLESPDFFYLYSGQEITGVMVTTGAGYQDKALKIDGMIWFEQPQSFGVVATGPDYSNKVFGTQLSLAFFL